MFKRIFWFLFKTEICKKRGHKWQWLHRVGWMRARRFNVVAEKVDERRLQCRRCGQLSENLGDWERHSYIDYVSSLSMPQSYWDLMDSEGMYVFHTYWSSDE